MCLQIGGRASYMIELNVRAFNFVVNTRAQRRAALAMIVKQLDMIRDAEIKCLENMPLNFRLSTKHNNGIAFVEMIKFGIDYLLESVELIV
jgi:hypothetical protein